MNKFKNDDATINAIVSSVGALAMVLTRRMTPEQRAETAMEIAALARDAEKRGDTLLETMLIDMHRAIR
ncbi:hypothetical protein [Pseudacidovorax intermedius]|uniref:hypothetical protein n=1 Tax=Pseudacidovorax intermedius TaxID=433924 RepID=UPI0026F076F6|nr:hypothetical protein [Pseudacidovorax intermedius]